MKISGYLILAGVVVIFFFGILVNIRSVVTDFASRLEELFQDETRVDVEMQRLMLTAIQPMGQLVTISSQFADPSIKASLTSGPLNLCGVGVEHSVEVTIEAGVDLKSVQAMHIFHDKDVDGWTLKLPSAQLTSCRIDYIRQQDHSFTLCTKDWDEIRLLVESVALKEFRDLALEEGILETAQEESRNALGSFVHALTGSNNIRMEFREDSAVKFPESCLREPPRGWTFDEESDTWKRE